MAKTKPESKSSTTVTLSERMQRQAEHKQLVKIKQLCSLITDQTHLESILLQEPNSLKRRAMYEMYKPHLTFESTYEGLVASAHSRPAPPQCTWNDPVLGRCRREGGFEHATDDGRIWATLCIGHRDRLVNAVKSGIQDVMMQAHVAARGGRVDVLKSIQSNESAKESPSASTS